MLIGSRNNLRVHQFSYSYYCAISDVRNYKNPLHIDSEQSIHAMNVEKKTNPDKLRRVWNGFISNES